MNNQKSRSSTHAPDDGRTPRPHRLNPAAAEALPESEERFRLLVESVRDCAIIMLDTTGNIVSWNSGAQLIKGYDAAEIIGQHFSCFYPAADVQRGKPAQGLALALKDGRCREEGWRVRKDGSQFMADVIITALFDEAGQPRGFSKVTRDITERKQAEEALSKAHDELELRVQQRTAELSQANGLLQTLLDNVPDHIYFKDAQGRFIRDSKSQATALGLSDPSQVVGKTDFDFFSHAQRAFDEEQEVMRSGLPLVDFEELVVWPDGAENWISTTKMPLRDPSGKIIGTFGISRDINHRKLADAALRRAGDELEAFSYSVSHDLRAPLRGIDGWSQALLEDYGGQLDAQGRAYIQRVRSEVQSMGQLIDDLLELSHVNRSELNKQQVDLSAIAHTLAARLQESEPQRQVEFKIDPALSVQGDSRLLEAALSNLLGNAFKFTGKTPQARIEFGQTEIEGHRAFFVRDNGAGFDSSHAQKLFGAFQRLHKASDFPGTGIGLAIVQRIVHRHGGRVWAEAALGQGATFYFTLEGTL